MTDQIQVSQVAELSFARGKVGQRYQLENDEQKADFASNLAAHSVPLTKHNTADCGDERDTVRLADGTTDPATLRERIVPQLFGGLGLATTKALLAADSPIVRDARTFSQAYQTVSELLAELGQEDGGHEDCGASKSVEASVANAIESQLLVPSVQLLVPSYEASTGWLEKNSSSKDARLQSGFYGGWDPQNHYDYLAQKFPQNFSYLKGDEADHETHGHNGSGIFVISQENVGFAKNDFIEDTGRQAFAVTAAKMVEMAQLLDPTEEGRMRIILGYVDDTLHVGAGIVTKDMPVFAS